MAPFTIQNRGGTGKHYDVAAADVRAAKSVTQTNIQNVFQHDKNFKQRKTYTNMSTHEKKIEQATAELAEAVTHETALEDRRAIVKLEAVERIMRSGDNSLTGKPHSFSSAEAIVNTDPTYQDYLAQQRDAVRARILARGAYEAALVAAHLAVKEMA
jgi:hypothetical protein